MLRKIIAVIAGLLFAVGLRHIFLTYLDRTWFSPELLGFLFRRGLPALIGGLTTGYMAQRRGWLYGFLMAIMFEPLFAVIWYRHCEPFIIINAIMALWVEYTWNTISAIPAGILGGFLGQLLAQKEAEEEGRVEC